MSRTIGYLITPPGGNFAPPCIRAMLEVCDNYYVEPPADGALPLLRHLIETALEPGDTLLLWSLSVFENVLEIVGIADAALRRGVHIELLTHGIRTDSPEGHLYLNLLAVLTAYERHRHAEKNRLHPGLQKTGPKN